MQTTKCNFQNCSPQMLKFATETIKAFPWLQQECCLCSRGSTGYMGRILALPWWGQEHCWGQKAQRKEQRTFLYFRNIFFPYNFSLASGWMFPYFKLIAWHIVAALHTTTSQVKRKIEFQHITLSPVTFVFLSMQGTIANSLTCVQLHKRAEKIAVMLMERGHLQDGDHVALVYPPGKELL